MESTLAGFGLPSAVLVAQQIEAGLVASAGVSTLSSWPDDVKGTDKSCPRSPGFCSCLVYDMDDLGAQQDPELEESSLDKVAFAVVFLWMRKARGLEPSPIILSMFCLTCIRDGR